MQIDLLGPVVVRRDDGVPVTPSAPKRRALLSALAVRLNQTVATEDLIELVWDGAAPPTARAALQGHVAALRQLLDATDLTLDTRGAGYLLAGDPGRVDLLRFGWLCDRAGLMLPDQTGAVDQPGPGPEDQVLPLLRTALDLWRGPVLADCGSALLRERVTPYVTDLRLRALDRLADGLLRVGRGSELAAELAEVASAHPTRQALAARLVGCLDQAGRRDEAMAWYDRAVAWLSGPPGPELREAGERLTRRPQPQPQPHADTRTGEPAPVPLTPVPPAAPAPVPQATTHDRRFVGRSAELARLDEVVPAARAGRPVLVTGPAGVGKSSLVRHWAQRSADRFPDGRLHADLRGFDPAGPREPAEVLGEFLTALGVEEAALPDDAEERAERFRELVAGRRVLIVLDGARSYEQIAPLLPAPPPPPAREPGRPGSGEHAPGEEEFSEQESGAPERAPVTVVTSRSRLRHLLVREGGIPLPLGVLNPGDADDLLARALDPARVAAAPEAAAELAGHCDHLPLALRLAAARLAARPDWSLGDLTAELADEQTGLAALAGTGRGPLGITAALDGTYRTLPPAPARLFTLLGLHPGAVIDTATAAALADLPPAVTRTLLNRLDAVHLLEETSPGHYARRELVRRYAVRQAADLGCEDRLDALDRLIAHYLAVTAAWTAEADDCGGVPGGVLGDAPGGSGAAAWFRREESALHAVVVCAEQYGRTAESWQLAHRIGLLYETTGADRSRWRAVVEAGLRSAQACADEAAVARLATDLAVLLVDRATYRAALEQLDQAVAAADRAGDRVLRHRCRGRVAGALLRAGRHGQALPLLTDLVTAARTPATGHLLARSLTDLADALVLAGAPGPALGHADEAVRTATAQSGGADAVLATHSRARALHALGRRDAALSTAKLAVALGRTVGDTALESRSHGLLADLLGELGRTVEATASRRRAQALLVGEC
ncbi:BTAD domain-containing putative transcriptional regulator [Kitasatospora sp. NPDC097643]|uniref:AfsR/SARP family transcriptional regulator n=1 Tax=Kitasatospora sp. NPDC097643 TaxID=3157230 RepID=UPI0033329152